MCIIVSGGIFHRQRTTTFNPPNEKHVTVYTGDTAVLECAVNNFGPKSVSSFLYFFEIFKTRQQLCNESIAFLYKLNKEVFTLRQQQIMFLNVKLHLHNYTCIIWGTFMSAKKRVNEIHVKYIPYFFYITLFYSSLLTWTSHALRMWNALNIFEYLLMVPKLLV